MRFLLKARREISDKEKVELKKQWELIFDEFLDEFGIPEHLVKILRLQRDISVMKLDRYLSGDASLDTFIFIKEEELRDAQNTTNSVDNFNESVIAIEKYMGFKFDVNVDSVRKYYGYIKLLNEISTKNKLKN